MKSRGWEKERREKLNMGFNELCKLLPDHDPSVTLSKMEILTRAAEYIRHLQDQNEDIIKCGSKTSLKNEAERLKKRVAFLLLKTKELVSALRVAGVPIPTNKKRKKSVSKKQAANSNTNNTSVQNGVATTQDKNNISPKKLCTKNTICNVVSASPIVMPTKAATTTFPLVANAGIVMTASPIMKPVVAAGLQPIGIDKKILSRLGPGTLILADGRVVNMPPIVPQIVVKPQPPAVLVMQRVKKGESFIAPKKRDVTKTTFTNKAPIPAIKTFRMESRPRSPRPRKKTKPNDNNKSKDISVSSVTLTVTTTTTTSTTSVTTVTSNEMENQTVPEKDNNTDDIEKVSELSNGEKEISALVQNQETNCESVTVQQNAEVERDKEEKSQSMVKYTIDALFNREMDKVEVAMEKQADSMKCSDQSKDLQSSASSQEKSKVIRKGNREKLITVEEPISFTEVNYQINNDNVDDINSNVSISKSVESKTDKEMSTCLNPNNNIDSNVNTNKDSQVQIDHQATSSTNLPSSSCTTSFYSSCTPTQSIMTETQATSIIPNHDDFDKRYLDKDVQQSKIDNGSLRKRDKPFYHNNVLNDDISSVQMNLFPSNSNISRPQMFSSNQNYYNQMGHINNSNQMFSNVLTSSVSTNIPISTARADIFSPDLSSGQNFLSNQGTHNDAFVHNTNNSLLKPQNNIFVHGSVAQFSNCPNQNIPNQIFTQNQKVLYSQTLLPPSSRENSAKNGQFTNKFVPSSIVTSTVSQLNCDNFSMNMTHRPMNQANQDPQLQTKFIPSVSLNSNVHASISQLNCDNFSMNSIANRSSIHSTGQDNSNSTQAGGFSHKLLPSSISNSNAQTSVSNINCDNFSMSNITHRSNINMSQSSSNSTQTQSNHFPHKLISSSISNSNQVPTMVSHLGCDNFGLGSEAQHANTSQNISISTQTQSNQFSHKLVPSSISNSSAPQLSCDNFRMSNITHRSNPASREANSAQIPTSQNLFSHKQVLSSVQNIVSSSSQLNCDNFSMSNITHRSNQETNSTQTQTNQNAFSHKQVHSNVQNISSSTSSVQLNCDNFSMNNITHRPTNSNQDNINNATQTNRMFSHKRIPSSASSAQPSSQTLNCDFSMNSGTHQPNIPMVQEKACQNQLNILNEPDSNMLEFNQNGQGKTAPVCVITKEKNAQCRDKNDKLYSTNTEGNSFKTDGAVCSHDLLRISKEIERNPFIPIDDVRLSSDFSNDLFSSLQVPTGGQHSESISPTAAFLLAFPLVSTSKNVDSLNEPENHENQTSTPTTILQIGNIDTPSTEMFQPLEFGKGKEYDMNTDYLGDVQMKCKRKEAEKKIKPIANNYQIPYNYPANPPAEYNQQYEQPWTESQNNKAKQTERKKQDKLQKNYNYEYYKNDKKKKSKISVHWMTTPETEVYSRENESSFLSSSSQYNMEIDNIPDLYTSKKNSYSWSPSKSLLPLDNNLMIPTSTLPTLVGDLALGTTTPSDVFKRCEKKTPEKNEEKRLQSKTQANFLSVSQLVDPKSKKLKPPERQYKKQEKRRNVNYPKRKDAQDPCMFNDNFVPNFSWDKRYKGNYSAESLIATQDINETFNYQQNNYFQNTEFMHDASGQSNQYQNCLNFPQNHFSSFIPDEYQSDNFGINNVSTRAIQPSDKMRSDLRYKEDSLQTNFLQGYYHSSNCPTTSSTISAQSNFNIPASAPSNFSLTTNTTTSLTNFNLSTIFPEMNDQRSAPSSQGNHGHMNSFVNQNYRSHPPI
ncbi:protein PF14_0175-like [Cimex lectularius]|uniref:BHLH domain-containing protein n=1 Tax=Cimex lectularius TaxID=79782 RepID=A0A8I6RF97_CIMLE|nr:protein PF14_0175-like [Cimex lectularius]